MKLVYICSPLRGDIEENIKKARSYCRRISMLMPDVIPIAPHIYCTQFLDDKHPVERRHGMDMGLHLLTLCDQVWVFGLENPSEGMQAEIELAVRRGITVRDGFEAFNRHKPLNVPQTARETFDKFAEEVPHVPLELDIPEPDHTRKAAPDPEIVRLTAENELYREFNSFLQEVVKKGMTRK